MSRKPEKNLPKTPKKSATSCVVDGLINYKISDADENGTQYIMFDARFPEPITIGAFRQPLHKFILKSETDLEILHNGTYVSLTKLENQERKDREGKAIPCPKRSKANLRIKSSPTLLKKFREFKNDGAAQETMRKNRSQRNNLRKNKQRNNNSEKNATKRKKISPEQEIIENVKNTVKFQQYVPLDKKEKKAILNILDNIPKVQEPNLVDEAIKKAIVSMKHVEKPNAEITLKIVLDNTKWTSQDILSRFYLFTSDPKILNFVILKNVPSLRFIDDGFEMTIYSDEDIQKKINNYLTTELEEEVGVYLEARAVISSFSEKISNKKNKESKEEKTEIEEEPLKLHSTSCSPLSSKKLEELDETESNEEEKEEDLDSLAENEADSENNQEDQKEEEPTEDELTLISHTKPLENQNSNNVKEEFSSNNNNENDNMKSLNQQQPQSLPSSQQVLTQIPAPPYQSESKEEEKTNSLQQGKKRKLTLLFDRPPSPEGESGEPEGTERRQIINSLQEFINKNKLDDKTQKKLIEMNKLFVKDYKNQEKFTPITLSSYANIFWKISARKAKSANIIEKTIASMNKDEAGLPDVQEFIVDGKKKIEAAKDAADAAKSLAKDITFYSTDFTPQAKV